MEARAFVFATRPGDFYRVGRTVRSLEAAGVSAEQIGALTEAKLRELLHGGGPLLFVRSGTWLVRTAGFKLPSSSATGKGLCALGALRAPPETEPETTQAARLWRDLFARTGGDFARLAASAAPASGTPSNSGSEPRPPFAKRRSRREEAQILSETGRYDSGQSLLTSAPTMEAISEAHSQHLPSSLLPHPCSVFLDSAAVAALAQTTVLSFEKLLRAALEQLRVVHYAPLDLYDDAGLRVLQVITALQRGGAERVTLDLMSELPAQNVRVRLATLGQPLREAFASPPRTIDLARAGANPEARGAALCDAAIAFGADVLHGHLFAGAELRQCAARGVPVVATVHNTRPGWPRGLASLQAQDANLLVACAQAVEADLHAAGIPVPVRTAWNGIDFAEFQLTPERLAAGREWRRAWGFSEDDFVLIAVANPRPQKRLQLLPGILAALRARLGSIPAPACLDGVAQVSKPAVSPTSKSAAQPNALRVWKPAIQQVWKPALPSEGAAPSSRYCPAGHTPDCGPEARLVLCGEAMPGNAEAERCVAETNAEIARLGLEPHVRWTGPVADVPDLLAAADALVCPSAHEGLSLAQLEALAMGCAVVATNVGGAREVAADNPDLHLLPSDASPEQFADILAKLVPSDIPPGIRPATGPPAQSSLAPNPNLNRNPNRLPSPKPRTERSAEFHARAKPAWSRQRMAQRYRWLYPRAIASARRSAGASGIWLVTNNFSTGGAQTSARRLLLGLASQGVPVRAAVVEEHPDNPTPGRCALREAGIPVLTLPPANAPATAILTEQLLTAIDEDPPQAVLFWNLRPSFKILLADAFLDVPIFDVSPGEMFYESLHKYFAESHPGLPYRTPRDYGARLAGVIVKYHAEAESAAAALGAPVHIIPNGVPLPADPPGEPAPRTRLVLGTAARINPQKRLADLLESLHLAHPQMPDYTLKIAGGVEPGCGGYADSLRTLANGLPVEWLGNVADISSFHRQLDIFVMVSEPAGCPNASLEALAAGLPVIATDTGGASEQVLDGRNGRLVPSRAPRPLADALVELARQPALRQHMGAVARDLVSQRFNLERMISEYRRVCLSP